MFASEWSDYTIDRVENLFLPLNRRQDSSI